jgi:23S rRNA pseudouridine1911/1915/1917 synthase
MCVLSNWLSLYEDPELLVLNKPAGLVCHPTKPDGHSSLIHELRLHLGTSVTPQMINRLDRETSGVLVVAKSATAARELRQLWDLQAVTKTYLAVVRGIPSQAHAIITASLGKDEQSQVAVKDCVRPDGKPALTEYWIERSFRRPEGEFALLRVIPKTGRKHQIRIHLAYWGHPIVGDKLYGGDETIYLSLVEGTLTSAQRELLLLPFQALHAQAIEFLWRGNAMLCVAEPEPWFQAFVAGGVQDIKPDVG